MNQIMLLRLSWFPFKSAKNRLSPCFDPLLMPTFREYYSSLHQDKKQFDIELFL